MIAGAVVHHVGFGVIELALRILAWGIQIGAVLLAAFLLAAVVQGVEEVVRKRRVRFRSRFLIVLLLICIFLTVLALNPPVICPERYESYLTPERRDAVQSVSSGLYSWNIPLVPICVHITGVNNFMVDGVMEYCVDFDVYYFCFGKLGMEYSTYDGINIADPIFQS